MFTQTLSAPEMSDVETGPTQSTALQESTGVRADPSLYWMTPGAWNLWAVYL